MNNFLLAITALATAGTIALVALMPTEGAPALMFVLPIAAGFGFAVARIKEDEHFLVRLFVSAVMVRIFLGSVIYYFHQQDFFGADANTFDIFGNALMKVWDGDADRKSTRLNSSHLVISYAVFCLKKKK